MNFLSILKRYYGALPLLSHKQKKRKESKLALFELSRALQSFLVNFALEKHERL